MKTNIAKLLVIVGLVGLVNVSQAYPVFEETTGIEAQDQHYQNAIYTLGMTKPAIETYKSIWAGTCDKGLLREIRDLLVDKVDPDYWFAFSRKLIDLKEGFFNSFFPIVIKVEDKQVGLSDKVCQLLKCGTAKELPNHLILTLFVISYLTDGELGEIEAADVPLKDSIISTIGTQYDHVLDSFFEPEGF